MEGIVGNNVKRLSESQQYWDAAAASFDNEPDHGLRDPTVFAAWTRLLKTWLPAAPAVILDAGCGTGSLSVALAGLGYQVTGIDLSPAMIALAKAKAMTRGRTIAFHVMDAAAPRLPSQQFDAIVCRHLLWALPDQTQVLQHWSDLLRPNGRLMLIEGFWKPGAGLHAQQIVEAFPATLNNISIQDLCNQPDLWGGDVTDERYAIIATRTPDDFYRC